MSKIFRPIGTRPEANRSLGREYWPGLHGKPTVDQAVIWCHGAKDGLAYAADIIRKSKSIDEVLARIEASTALPTDRLQDGHEYETAVITERSDEGVAWWAWSLHTAGDQLPGTFREISESGPTVTEPARLSPGKVVEAPTGWLSGDDMIGAFYAK